MINLFMVLGNLFIYGVGKKFHFYSEYTIIIIIILLFLLY